MKFSVMILGLLYAIDEKNHRIRYWKNDTFLRFGRNARLELAA